MINYYSPSPRPDKLQFLELRRGVWCGLHDSAKMMLDVKYFSLTFLSNAEQRERERERERAD